MMKYWARVLTPNLLLILLFEESAKKGFGAWLIVLSTYFTITKILTGDIWLICMLLAGGSITGGSMFDKWMELKQAPFKTTPEKKEEGAQ
jgi:hypothetical protein